MYKLLIYVADIKAKNAIVNIENQDDEMCFAYSIIAQLRPTANANLERAIAEYRQHLHLLNMEGKYFS